MILIKDRHWTVRINSRAFAHSGNMILIKDRHELNGKYGDEKIQGNMILTKDEE